MDSRLLIVEDEDTLRDSLKRVFQREGYQVEAVVSAEPALELFEESTFDLIITDIILPGITGIELLKRVKEINPDQIVIIITAYASLETAVETLRAGAYDYIVKPIIHEEIKQIVKNALRQRALQKENILLKKQVVSSYDLSRIIGENPEIQKISSRIKKIAETRSPVLCQGERGTGKKLIARAIHFSSHRAERTFLPIHIRSIPEDRRDRELFGHTKGFLGDAGSTPEGLLIQSGGGTVFLDSIEALSLDQQRKLLMTLEDQGVKPPGPPEAQPLDMLLVASSTQDLEILVQEGKFREDLYQRLKVITIKIPPLRERKEDLEGLAGYFLEIYEKEFGKQLSGFDPPVLALFKDYHWPGNVRELRNVIERAVLIADEGLIQTRHIPTFKEPLNDY